MLAVAMHAMKVRRLCSVRRGAYSKSIVLLDADRLEGDLASGRDPVSAVRQEDVELVYLRPNLEGLLVRLHPGYENHSLRMINALVTLKSIWPNYRKPISADALDGRFVLQDLQRAAKFDNDLELLLGILGLPTGIR